MCITAAPGNLDKTRIVDISATPDNDTERILSYMNQVEAPGQRIDPYLAQMLGRTVVSKTLPNAMLFAVYGQDVEIVPCVDPKASRAWMLNQSGLVQESWHAQPMPYSNTRSLRGDFLAKGVTVVPTGNYNAAVAKDVDDIPNVIETLRQVSTGEVPDVPPEVLERMKQYYRLQNLGMPRIVIAAYALSEGSTEDMHPITVRYHQMESVQGKVVLPALDYHGQGDWKDFVERDHELFVSTNELDQILAPIARSTSRSAPVPSELGHAPIQMAIQISDHRDSRSTSDEATWAPNNDYVVDTDRLTADLRSAAAALAALTSSEDDDYTRRYDGLDIVNEHLNDDGLMSYTNQAATTVAAYRTALAR